MRWRRTGWSSIVAVCLLVHVLGAAGADVRRLETAQAVASDLAGGIVQSYEVVLAADEYIEVEAQQLGINLALTLVDPAGRTLLRIDAVKTRSGAEFLAAIADTAGTYRIDIRPVENHATPGKFRITLRERRTPTPDDRVLEQARRLSEQARALRAKGAYADALKAAQAALALREDTLGPDDAIVGDSLHQVAVLYDNVGDYAKAEPINRRALAIREKALGTDHPDVADTLNNLAWIASVKYDYAQAEELYRRALAIQERAFGPDDPEIAATLNDFALLYTTKGAYERALELDRRVTSIRERAFGGDDAGVAKALNNTALAYEDKGDYTHAASLYVRALAVWEKALGADHPETAFAVDNLARMYLQQGDYARAEPLFQRALAIREKALGPDHPNTATSLNNLAAVYLRIGDRDRAAPLLSRALAADEKRFGPDTPEVAPSLSNLARLYERAGDDAAAEPLYRRALAVRQKALDPNHSSIGDSLNDLGQLYVRTGQDEAEAERLLGRSQEILEKAFGPRHPSVAKPVGSLAELYDRRGDDRRAEEAYLHALAIREGALGPDHPDVADALDRLGSFYRRRGDLRRAIALMIRSGDIRERSLTHNLALGSERQKTGYLELFAKDIDNALSLQARLGEADAQALQLAFTTVLRRKGRALDAATDNLSALRSHATPEDEAIFRQLADERSQLALLTLKGPVASNAAQYPALVKQREEAVDRLEADLSRRSLEFRAYSTPITLAAVQSVIPSGAALVEFARYRPVDGKAQPRYAAYVLVHDGDARWVDLGEAPAIDRTLETWRGALRDPARTDVRRLARAVDGKLMQPVRGLLGASRHLLISPDGPLNLVPFAALVDEKGGYLVERFMISYLTSGRDLLRMQATRASRGRAVVVADPAFGEPALAAPGTVDDSQVFFGPLPGVAAEVRALKGLMPGATFHTRDQATEAAVKQVSGPRILHLATHGFFLQDRLSGTATPAASSSSGTRVGRFATYTDNPLLRSGLAFAGANRGLSGADDGLLTALEAAGLDLWGTKLVVLSACDTGVGEVRNGDGVYGLRRAFVLAGAESQMMSLWPVPDRSTSDLMAGYYTRLTNGDSRGDALRAVQLHLLARQPRAHPYYWAGFILSGQWAPLDGPP